MDCIYVEVSEPHLVQLRLGQLLVAAFVALKCQGEFHLNFNVLQLCKIKLVASIVIRAESCTDSFYHM